MTSIFGALLTAGYASAMGKAIAAVADRMSPTRRRPAPARRSRARTTLPRSTRSTRADHVGGAVLFLDGDELGLLRGDGRGRSRDVARLLLLPKKDEEEALRAGYHASDSAATEKPPQARMPAAAPAGADV